MLARGRTGANECVATEACFCFLEHQRPKTGVYLSVCEQICAIQLAKGLKGVSKEQMKQVTIAYEPVWAIGTGLVCDAPIAQDVHKFIR